MSQDFNFFIPLARVPTITHQEQRIGVSMKNGKPAPYVYKSQELLEVKHLFMDYLQQHQPKEKIQGPIRLMVKWLFQAPKRQKTSVEWKTTKPDTDNLIKLLKDAMTATHFWEDDAQVCSEITEKFFVKENTGIWISVEALASRKE